MPIQHHTLEHGDFQRTLDNQVGPQNTHGADTDTRFCSSISSTKAREYDGGGAAHSTKEWLHINQYDAFDDLKLSSDSFVLYDEVVEGATTEGLRTAYTGLQEQDQHVCQIDTRYLKLLRAGNVCKVKVISTRAKETSSDLPKDQPVSDFRHLVGQLKLEWKDCR